MLQPPGECSDWASAYVTTGPEEDGYHMEVHGHLPSELTGTYFRNGPGAFELGGQAVAHPFDGAGLVSSIAIRNGRAFFRSRYVDTAERRAELQHNKILFRGTFGTQQPGLFANLLDVVPKNAANTNVLLWADKCWALFEAGQPHRLNPLTLETEGLDLLGGHLRAGVPFTLGTPKLDRLAGSFLRKVGVGRHLPAGLQMGGDALTAHPRVDPATGNLVMYSYRLRLGPAVKSAKVGKGFARVRCNPLNRLRLHTEVTFWEFDQAMQLVSKSQHSLPGYAFLHDFTVTQHYYVIFRNPVGLALLPFLLGRKAAVHAVRWHPNKPLAAHLIPRPPTNQEPNRLESTIKHQTIDCRVPENNRHREDSCDRPLADHLTLWGCTHHSPTPVVSQQGKQHTDHCIGVGASGGSHSNITRSPEAHDKPQPLSSLRPNLLRGTSAENHSLDCNSTSAETSSSSNGNSSISSTLTDLSVHNPGVESAAMHSCQEQVCLTQQTGVNEHIQVLCSTHACHDQDSLQPQHQSSVVLGQHLGQSPHLADKSVPQQQASQADLHVPQQAGQADLHVIQGQPGFVFHHGNAFETAEGCVVVDAIRYPTLPDFDQACGSGRNFVQDVKPELQPISQLWRFTLNPQSAHMEGHPLSQRAMEYPSVNPDLSGCQIRFVYTAAALHPTLNRAQQALVKTDMETSQSWLWCKHDRYYAGEPAFIPKQKSQPISPPDAWVSHQHDQLGDLAKIPCKKQQQQQQQQQNCQSDVQLQEQLKRLKRQQQTQVGPQRSEYTACHLSSESLAEDEGWLMALCYDAAAHCSELVVLDAQRIEAGPITILPLRKTIPHGLHGNWSNEYFGP